MTKSEQFSKCSFGDICSQRLTTPPNLVKGNFFENTFSLIMIFFMIDKNRTS